MMVYFMFFGKDSEHGHGSCRGMMDGSKENEFEKEIATLKAEIDLLKKGK
jgi:hypothetical protein